MKKNPGLNNMKIRYEVRNERNKRQNPSKKVLSVKLE